MKLNLKQQKMSTLILTIFALITSTIFLIIYNQVNFHNEEKENINQIKNEIIILKKLEKANKETLDNLSLNHSNLNNNYSILIEEYELLESTELSVINELKKEKRTILNNLVGLEYEKYKLEEALK